MSKHQARKRFGQHFLVDSRVVDNIVRAIAPANGENLVEIGPGLSALTGPLLKCIDHLKAIEIDRDLADRLSKQYPVERLTVVEADVLKVDFQSQFGENIRIVGNLPYNISTPLLFHLMKAASKVRDQHFMLQLEVANRMAAKPSHSDYGRLSVVMQSRYQIDKLFDVAPTSFSPAPRVVSAVVRMVPLPSDRIRPLCHFTFEQVVKRAFSQRRKMLRKSLGNWATNVPWSELGIEPTSRAGELSVAEYIDLSDFMVTSGLLASPHKK